MKTPRVPRLAPALAGAAIAAGLFAGVGTAAVAHPTAPVDPAAGLTIAADAQLPGYDRLARFGGWRSTGPGCDVRDVVLARDLSLTTRVGCDVRAGTLRDPYSGVVTVGPTRALDVDHVYPLELAWQTGAASWTDAQRRAFANDPANLRAVSAHDNRSKGDGGPEEWLPARERCLYVEAFADTARRYHLTATVQRVAAIRGACR